MSRTLLCARPSPLMVGIEGWVSATNHYRTGASNPVLGDISGFWVSMLVHVLATPAAGILWLAQSSTGGANGWSLITSSGALGFGAANGAGAGVFSPTAGAAATVAGIVAADVGKTLHLVGVFDGAGPTLRMYRSASEISTGSAIVGYTNPTAAGLTAVGSTASGTGSSPWARIVGMASRLGIPTLADIAAHYAACKSELGMALMTGAGITNTRRWQARANIPPAAWVDDLGGITLNKTGTLSATRFLPTWEQTPVRTAHLGDSITSNSAYHRAQLYADSIATLKSVGPYSSGTYPGNLNSGVSGETLVQMEARVAADITAYTPNLIIIHGGTNDASGGASGATMGTRLATLLATIRAGNPTAVIVVCAIPPRLGFETACSDFNVLIPGICAVVDSRVIAIDPGLTADDVNGDGVHPNITAGATKLGDAIYAQGVVPALVLLT